MSAVTQDQIQSVLKNIQYPGFNKNILSIGVVSKINIQDNRITVTLKLAKATPEIKKQVKSQVESALNNNFSDNKILVIEADPQLNISAPPSEPPRSAPRDPWAGRGPIPGINSIVAVASGKGGVGKSTVAANLAIALSMEHLKVGLMDSDIYGPSIQIMMGVDEKPVVSREQKLLPIEKHGIRMMSMGFIVDKDAPLIWRGPMIAKAVEQFIRDVDWGALDTLVIDLPPGTGDTQLTLVQKVPITGAIIVTTPQEVALVDARRGIKMFQKVETEVFGIIENMSYFACPQCGDKSYIFGKGGGSKAANELNVTFLGEVPIDPEVTETGDSGVPIVAKNPDSEVGRAFRQIALRLISEKLKEKVG
jgi:ATP-binding protein involved in chromosome partitioning